MRLAALLVALAAPAEAQEPDCAKAVTQAALNLCALRDFEAADAELNRAYAGAVELAGIADADGGRDLARRLRDAQRAWIAFRDAACDAEAAVVEGGSMQPMVGNACLARLSWARADDLYAFSDSLGLGTPTP